MNADEMKNILDTSLAQMMGKLNSRFDKLEAKIGSKADKEDVDRILGAVDSMSKLQETEEQERLAMNRQLERHEKWHHQTAKKLDLNLDY